MTIENKHIPVKRKREAVIGDFKSKLKTSGDKAKIMFPGTPDIIPATVYYCLEVLKYMLSYSDAKPVFSTNEREGMDE